MSRFRSNINLPLTKQNSKECLANVAPTVKKKEQPTLSQGQKKKRTALENISNAASTAKDASKKSRFSSFANQINPVFGISIGKKDSKYGLSKENVGLKTNKKIEITSDTGKENKNSFNLNDQGLNKISFLNINSSNLKLAPECERFETLEKQSCITQNTSNLEEINNWEDIDAIDSNDEFNATDYVICIFKYYRERQDKFNISDYLKNQPTLNKQMRHLLVDWMVEVQQQLEFNHEVLYLSVKLLDLYLNNKRVDKEKLQLLGGAAMFISCKYEERIPPAIDDFIYVSDNAYSRQDLIKMEIDILKTVRFDLGVPLSYTFLRRYAKCIHADMKFLTLARYILELALQEYSFSYVNDSIKACAALYLALKITETNDIKTKEKSNITSTEWNPTLIHYTETFLEDFIEYVPLMNNLVKSAPSAKYKTIFKKYSHQVFYEVAKVPGLNDNEMEELKIPVLSVIKI